MNGYPDEQVRIELLKKKDKMIPIIIGSFLTVATFFIFGWVLAIIAFVLTIGFSIRTYKANCPKCSHRNSIHNHAHNLKCAKCRTLILIDWKQ